MGKTIRRAATALGATGVGLALLTGTASAHVVTVTDPNTGELIHMGWLGAGGAAHVHGLIDACQAVNGNDVLSISAPWNQVNNCKHVGP